MGSHKFSLLTLLLFAFGCACTELGLKSVPKKFLELYFETFNHKSFVLFSSVSWELESASSKTSFMKTMSIMSFPGQWSDINTLCGESLDGNKFSINIVIYSKATFRSDIFHKCSTMEYFGPEMYWLFISTSIEEASLVQHLGEHNILLDSNINIAVFENKKTFKVREIYKITPNASLIIQDVNIRNRESIQTFYFKEKRRANFQGLELRAISVVVNKIYIEIKYVSGNPVVSGGLFGETFTTLQNILNFTYSLNILDGYSYGYPRKNGNWSGLLGILQKKEADISTCEVSLAANRLNIISFSPPIREARLKLYVKSTMKDLTYQYFLLPFQPIVWLVIVACVLLLTTLKWSFHRAGIRKTRFAAAFFTVISSFLQQGNEDPRTCSLRIFHWSTCAMFMVIGIGYGARLTATSTLHKHQVPIRDLLDIIYKPHWKLGIVADSFALKEMEGAEDNSSLKRLHEKVTKHQGSIVDNVFEGLTKVLQIPKYAFLGLEDACQQELLEEFSSEKSCLITQLSNKYFKGYLGFAIQKKSQFKRTIDYSVLKLHETGIINHLIKKWIPHQKMCNTYNHQPADFSDILPLMIIFFSGILLSLIILLMEIWFHDIRKVNQFI